MNTDIAVAGGGPAGLLAALAAARSGAQTLLLEGLSAPGRKLLASGNGRCNFGNVLSRDELCRSFGEKARFVRPAFSAFPPERWRAFLAERGVAAACDDGFHYFPAAQKASEVLAALRGAAEAAGARILCGARLKSAVRNGDGFRLLCTNGRSFEARELLLACGGASCPELGARGEGFALAQSLGHTIVAPVPALASLHLKETWAGALAGITLPCAAAKLLIPGKKTAFEPGELLFTHRGVSGPAVLDWSGTANRVLAAGGAAVLSVRFRAERDEAAWHTFFTDSRQNAGGRSLRAALAGQLPQRLADALLAELEIPGETLISRLPGSAEKRLCAALAAWEFHADGSDSFDRAMATAGGVALGEVEPKTLQSRLVPGLFFAGEILDVDGRCGGYNIQWAASSGFLAGSAGAARLQSSLSSSPNS